MTSPVDTSVKYFHSGMTGAPVLSGTAGALIAVLDACLVNGFGLKTVDSLVVTGNVATMNISTGHSAEAGGVQLIAGATPSALNGEQKVTATTATTITFATTGIADQTATGTITAKVAPAGWAKTFSDTNLAAYKSTDITATGCLLRVDDTGTTSSRVVGYETMSDVNTGTGRFPTEAQRAGGSWWSKSYSADSAARKWVLVSDGAMFYFGREFHSSYVGATELTGFGDILPTKSGDAFSCILSAMPTDKSSAGATSSDNLWWGGMADLAELYTPRSYTGLGSSNQMKKSIPQWAGNAVSIVSGLGYVPYPNPTDGGVYLTPMYFNESTYALRGMAPGLYPCTQAISSGQFATCDSVVGVTSLSGRVLKAVTCTIGAQGVIFLDITGPWR